MQLAIAVFTLVVYGCAGYLWWRDGTANYVIALLAGQLGTLLSPLWQFLYRFAYTGTGVPALAYLGHSLPRSAFFGGWLMILPAIFIFFLYRARWWFPGYTTGLLTFVVFVVYHLLGETLGVRLGVWQYDESILLPFGLRLTLLAALMNGLASFGMLSLMLLTRRYGLTSLLLLLLPAPFILMLFVRGLLGAPLYTALLLQSHNLASSWATFLGAVGTLALLLWSAHTIASVLEGQQASQPMTGGRAQSQS